jgi:hypothetical protein
MVVSVAESRSVPPTVAEAYDRTIVTPLPEIFAHRHLALPRIVRVQEQEGTWGGPIGQTRTILTSDGGSMRETLTIVDRPHRFGYRIDVLSGPMRPLVSHLDGRWAFEPGGSRTTITWSWDLHPRSVLTTPLVVVIGRMWHGYARHALVTLESILVTP